MSLADAVPWSHAATAPRCLCGCSWTPPPLLGCCHSASAPVICWRHPCDSSGRKGHAPPGKTREALLSTKPPIQCQCEIPRRVAMATRRAAVVACVVSSPSPRRSKQRRLVMMLPPLAHSSETQWADFLLRAIKSRKSTLSSSAVASFYIQAEQNCPDLEWK